MQLTGETVTKATLRTSSIRQLAGAEGTDAPSWWCYYTEVQKDGSNGFSLQKDREDALCKLDDIK